MPLLLNESSELHEDRSAAPAPQHPISSISTTNLDALQRWILPVTKMGQAKLTMKEKTLTLTLLEQEMSVTHEAADLKVTRMAIYTLMVTYPSRKALGDFLENNSTQGGVCYHLKIKELVNP